MNKHILFVMRSLDNPELFTQAEKEANNRNAYTAYDDAYAAAYATDAAVYPAADADSAAYAAYASYADADAAYVDRCINKFFGRSGEDKQTYIDEVERLKGE